VKYIMFELTLDGVTRYVPVIFPDILVHADVAKRVGACEPLRGKAKVRSAGSIQWEADQWQMPARVVCSGSSETLDVTADPNDGRIIENYPHLHGIPL
jgi:hypothetical protein